MKNIRILSLSMLLALTAATIISCVKTEFDEPPITGTPVNIQANTTIKELKQRHATLGGFDKITEDLIIEGVVVMDDRSGNYYKTIVIQDASGGIEVLFNDGYLYNQYPIGRTIYIKCKDLVLTDYNGLTQLTGGTKEEAGVLSDVGITEAQGRDKVLKGLISETPPAPRVITINQVGDPNFISTLVKIEDVQFIKADTAETYADAVSKNSLNRTLETCSGGQLLVRSSGFADFAGQKTPGGKGTVTGILSAFGNTPQLYIRNTADVAMTDARCGNGGGGGGTGGTVESVDEPFSTVTTNQDVALPGWANIASVGGRLWRGNSFSGNFYVQATAFGSSDATNEMWLISPAVTVSTQKTLTFESSWAYYKHQGLTAWYSTDFNGQDVNAATWQPLTSAYIAQAGDIDSGSFGKWMPSGNVALPVIAGGKVYVGFKYTGDKAANTTTWRLDNIKIQ